MRVFWLDRKKLLLLAMAACQKILGEHRHVLKAGVFGSVATGRAAPGSDLDILIVLPDLPGPRHHASEPFQEYFSEIEIGTEIHCAVEKELETNPFFARASREAVWAPDPRLES